MPAHRSLVALLAPNVLLVREESPQVERALLDAGQRLLQRELATGVRILRSRHAIPACERMGVTHPLLIVLGDSLSPDDVGCLMHRAMEIDAEVLQPHIVPPDQLALFIEEALVRALCRRESRREHLDAKSA